MIRREEAALAVRHGAAFAAYAARTPRFGPRLWAWRDLDSVEASPRLFLRTVGDGLFFLAAVPLFEALEWAQLAGHWPVLARLP